MATRAIKVIPESKSGTTQTKTIQPTRLPPLKRPGQAQYACVLTPSVIRSRRQGGVPSIRRNNTKAGDDGAEQGTAVDKSYKARLRRRETEKVTKITRAPGAQELDASIRIGPDVIHEYVERTPLSLWTFRRTSMVNFRLMEKDSDEIVPTSPREIDETESELFLTRKGKTPPMSWSANLTELEEEDFKAEGPFIDNVKLAHTIPMESEEDNKFAIKKVLVKDNEGNVETKERVRVILTETDTVFLIMQPGKLILEKDVEKFAKTEANNLRYQKLLEKIAESESYVDRSTQTFLERERDKSTQAYGVGCVDAGNYCNKYIMIDEFNLVKEMETKKQLKEEEEARLKELAELNQEELPKESEKKESSGESSDDDSGVEDEEIRPTIDWPRLEKEEEEQNKVELRHPSEINDEELEITSEDEFDVDIQLDELYKLRVERETKLRPKFLPDISFDTILLERLISTNTLQSKHLEARGFENPFKTFEIHGIGGSKNVASLALTKATALIDTGPKLVRFWLCGCSITKGKEITGISTNPANGNLVAASYGSTDFSKPSEGVVCIWNLKNINYPERIYTFHTSATAIAFSELTPYLLGIALLDGNVLIYDVRQPGPVIVCSTLQSTEKHHGPVWDIAWIQETEIASTGSVTEALVTLSDDGYLYKWSSTKGFLPSIMLKIRRSTLKIPGRRERRAEALISQLSASFTLCFYPDDFTQYLIGTEEGFIHKATTAYTEQFVGTYIGHTGPVYRISFAPFAKDIFISCGGDWSIKIWKEDMPNALITFSTGLRTIYDIAWAPTISTVFVCASDEFIEVWDLTVNTLEPIIQYNPPFTDTLRRVVFWDYLQAVLIGDDDGGLTSYSLRNFPPQPIQPEDQMDNLLEAIIPGYKKRKANLADMTFDDEVEGIEELVKLAQTSSAASLKAYRPSSKVDIGDNALKSTPSGNVASSF